MKIPQLQLAILAGLMSLPVFTETASAESAQELMTQAQAAYLRGDLEAAKRDFTLVNRLNPQNPAVIGYLRMIAAQEAKKPAGNAQQKQLETLIIPKIEFRDATLGSTLEFLKKAAEKGSDGKVAVSFVVQLPEEQVKSQTLTVSLANIPFTEALRYVGGLANVEFAYEKYAIVVRPITPGLQAAQAPK